MSPTLAVGAEHNCIEDSYTQWRKVLEPVTVEASNIELFECIGQGVYIQWLYTTYPELSLLASFPGHFHIITCSNKKETEVLHSTKIFKGQNFHRLAFHGFCRNIYRRSTMVTVPTQVMWLAVSITFLLCSAALAWPSDNWYYESLLEWLATVHLLLARFSLQLNQWSKLMKYPLQHITHEWD